MTSVNLPLPNGGVKTFDVTHLEQVLAHLSAGQLAYVEVDSVALWRAGTQALLLVYTGHFPNRRLLEQFELSFDPQFFESLKFRSDPCTGDLQAALLCIGVLVPDPLTLASQYMLKYSTGAEPYLAPSNMVSDQGAFATRPAALKALAVSAGLTLTPRPAR